MSARALVAALQELLDEPGVQHLQPPNWRTRIDQVLVQLWGALPRLVDQARAEERHRIVWWLRQVAGGPAAVHASPDYLLAVTELADVIEQHPDRFADAPAHPRGQVPS